MVGVFPLSLPCLAVLPRSEEAVKWLTVEAGSFLPSSYGLEVVFVTSLVHLLRLMCCELV